MTQSDALRHYRLMMLIRHFEEAVERLFDEGHVHGTTHLCIGQEACAVGACDALDDGDVVVSNHRGHGHFLARGADPQLLMAELYGKRTGYSRGRGGTQHMSSPEIGFLGTTGITGGGLPIATGAALAMQLQDRKGITLCFFGDGASNQGTFHESLNLASVWDLPVIYFCENNLYAMSTSVERAMPVQNVADRAQAYGMHSAIVDGNDSFAVRKAVLQAAEEARGEQRPFLIEAKTYRHCGHSKSDRREYRSAEEENFWKQRDPIKLLRERIISEKLSNESELEKIVLEVDRQISDAIEFAESSDEPNDTEIDSVFA